MGKKKERRREDEAKEQKKTKMQALAQEVADLKVRMARVESSNHAVAAT